MSFAAPWLLWGLLGLLPLIAIYFLKIRPARKPATAWFLWEKIFEERRARTLFERFRDVFSLLLMALVFLAVVAAAARPYWTGDSRRDLILVIDNSASMNADDRGQSRLERAKRLASQMVRALDGNQRCSIATTARDLIFLSGLTDNPRELLEAIEKIEATPLPSSVRALQPLVQPSGPAGAELETGLETGLGADHPRGDADDPDDTADGNDPLVGQEGTADRQASVDGDQGGAASVAGETPRIVLLSDGCLDSSVPEGIEWIKIGDPGPGNLGIVACDLQRLPIPGEPVGVFVQIASSFREAVTVDLAVCYETPDQLQRLIPLEVQPGINSPEIFQIETTELIDLAGEGRWLLRLEIDDMLADDNVAYAVLPPRVPVDVAVVAQDRFFYDSSVRAFSTGDRLLRLASPEDAQVLMTQGAIESLSTDSDLLIFQPNGESEWWAEAGEEIAVAVALVPDEDHPLLRHLDATTIPWLGARRLQPPPGAEVLVVADDGTPLMYRAVHRGRRAVVVNLDPAAGEFFLSPWFPVLVYSAATHLAGRVDVLPAAIPTGQSLDLPEVEDPEGVQWLRPDGSLVHLQSAGSGPLSQIGFHSFGHSLDRWWVGCSLLSSTETLVDNADLVDNAQPITSGWSPAFWLTLLAIAFVFLESVLYHRRWVG